MTEAQAVTADVLLLGGDIWTMDARDSTAQAAAIKDGRFLAVGSDAEIGALAGPSTRVVELGGRTVLPGLIDSHVHLASDAGRAVDAVDCRDLYDPSIRSVADVCDRVREAAGRLPAGTWIAGRASSLQDMRLKEKRVPTRAELDAAAPEHPVSVAFGPHITVVNSLALKAKGITAESTDPAGGTIARDESGQPNGVLLERAQFLVRPKAAGLEPADLAEYILLELQRSTRRGVTMINDIVISREEVQAYQLLARQGRLPVRIQMLLRVIESNFDKKSLLDLGFQHGFGSDWLRIGGVKMSIDGGFTGKNAVFSHPIHVEGEEDHQGLVRIEQDELDETVWRYHELGMRCCVHAIGDVAVDMALTAYERALERLPRTDHRHRVEHLGNWMITPEVLQRIKKLQVLPMANPSFMYLYGQPLTEMLGTRVTEQGFPLRTLWDAGFPLAFGSDGPGPFPIDPLRDLGVAVDRLSQDGTRLVPSEALTLEESVRACTANAAWVGFMEDRLGKIQPGMLADLVVLGESPRIFPKGKFRDLPVDITIAGGQFTYESASVATAMSGR